MPRPPCDDAMFVVAWNSGRSIAQVARDCGYTGEHARDAAGARAKRLRRRGVQLRYYARGPQPDVERLRYLAVRAAEDANQPLPWRKPR